jgi:peroxin-5
MNEYAPMPPTFFQSSVPSQLQQPHSMNWDQEFSRVDTKGKGKAIDADFEAAFARAAASITTNKEGSRIVDVQDDAETLEDAFERVKVTDPPEKVGDTDGMEYLTDFQK